MDGEFKRALENLSIKEPALSWPAARRKLASLAGVEQSKVPDSLRDEWDRLRLAALEFQRDRFASLVNVVKASLRARRIESSSRTRPNGPR